MAGAVDSTLEVGTPVAETMEQLEVVRLTQGPAATNAYLVADRATGEAVVVDPAWDGEEIRAQAEGRGWRIGHIWLTHAHFDHLGGAAALSDGAEQPLPVALHPLDHPLWQINGGAAFFGFPQLDPGPEPTIDLAEGMIMRVGRHQLEVHHTPGHTAGHVIFDCRRSGLVLCGDLIFQAGVGRVDLPQGDMEKLLASIKQHILPLPDETRLLPGHGPETTVGRERVTNPFLLDL